MEAVPQQRRLVLPSRWTERSHMRLRRPNQREYRRQASSPNHTLCASAVPQALTGKRQATLQVSFRIKRITKDELNFLGCLPSGCSSLRHCLSSREMHEHLLAEGRGSRLVWGCARLWASSERFASPFHAATFCGPHWIDRLQGDFQNAHRSPCRLTGFHPFRFCVTGGKPRLEPTSSTGRDADPCNAYTT